MAADPPSSIGSTRNDSSVQSCSKEEKRCSSMQQAWNYIYKQLAPVSIIQEQLTD